MSTEAVSPTSTTANSNADEPSSSSTSTSNNTVELKKPDLQSYDKALARFQTGSVLIASECNFKLGTTENHLKRLQNLRKEVNYINDTDWMYETLDKKFQI